MSRRSPRLALAALVVALAAGPVAASPAQAACSRAASASVVRLSLSTARAQTLCLLNRIRRSHGLRPLRDNAKLRRAAVGHSRSMVRGRYFSHGNFIGRILRTGYASGALSWLVGENIAYGSRLGSAPSRIVRRWMNSPPHRANILNGRFRHIGIGIVRGTPRGTRGGTYTTDFGTRG